MDWNALELEPPRWPMLMFPIQSWPGFPKPQVHTSTSILFLASDRSNCWPLVSTIKTGSVGAKPIAASRAQQAVPAARAARSYYYPQPQVWGRLDSGTFLIIAWNIEYANKSLRNP